MDTRRKRIWLKLKLYVKNSGWDWILSSVVAGRRRPCLVTGDCTHALGGRGRIPTFQDPNRRSDPCIYNVKNALLACAIYLYVRIYHGGKKESKRKGARQAKKRRRKGRSIRCIILAKGEENPWAMHGSSLCIILSSSQQLQCDSPSVPPTAWPSVY